MQCTIYAPDELRKKRRIPHQGVIVLSRHAEALILCRDEINAMWVLPQGMLSRGESAEETARRVVTWDDEYAYINNKDMLNGSMGRIECEGGFVNLYGAEALTADGRLLDLRQAAEAAEGYQRLVGLILAMPETYREVLRRRLVLEESPEENTRISSRKIFICRKIT